MPLIPLDAALHHLDRAVEAGRFPRDGYAERKAWLRAHVRGDGTVEVPDGWLGAELLPHAPPPDARLHEDIGPPGPWLSRVLRVLGVLAVVVGLFGAVAVLSAGQVYDYDTGRPYGYADGALPAALATAFSGLTSAVILLTLAHLLDVVRAITPRSAPRSAEDG